MANPFSAQNYRIVSQYQTTFAPTISLYDSNGDPVDLTGYTASFVVYNPLTLDAIITLTPSVLDNSIVISHDITETPGAYSYNLNITNVSEVVTGILFGSFIIQQAEA